MRSDVVIGSAAPTKILDVDDPLIQRFVRDIGSVSSQTGFLRQAHVAIGHAVRPIYSLNEWQRASRTLARGRGSCSQRFAVLEATSRAAGIPTRVRGLSVNGRFWYPRFPRMKLLVPDRVILAWPEFGIEGDWVTASELFGSLSELQQRSDGRRFANDGESLFDAIGVSAIDWEGATSAGGITSTCDLSGMVGEDLGLFDARDELFATYRTVGRTTVRVIDPILRLLTERRGRIRP